jgi:hypothetical protein
VGSTQHGYARQVSHGEGESNRVPLPGSPFRVAIAPAATHAPSCVRLFVEERDAGGHGLDEPLSPSTGGLAASFFFAARDRHNNARAVGGDLFSAVLHGPELVQAEVEDQCDGTYAVRYCPRRAGAYELAVTRGETHIAGSPFSLAVQPGPTHAAACVAHGAALQLGEAGERQSFLVEARDAHANPTGRGGDRFIATIVRPHEEPATSRQRSAPEVVLPCDVVDRGDGTYEVRPLRRRKGR